MFVVGDVARNSEGADNLTGGVVQRCFGAGDPGDTAIGPSFFLLDGNYRLAGRDNVLFIGESLLGVLVGETVKICFANESGGTISPGTSGFALVDAEEATFQILKIDMVRRRIHQVLQKVTLRS